MSGFILGSDLEAEVEDPLPSPLDLDSPIPVEVISAPEIDVDVSVPDIGTIEMDVITTDVLVLPVAGPKGADGATDPLVGVAGEVLSGHRVVVGTDVLFYADPTTLTDAGRATYLTLGAALMGAEVQIVAAGRVVEPSWAWTPGLPLYLAPGGQLTQTIPVGVAFLRTVGWAETSIQIYFAPQFPVSLGP